MKYIRSRSEFLNHKKHNLILEGGLENDINWGDSLVGRLFSSMFRVAKMGVDIKRMDGAGSALRDLFNKSVETSIKDPKKIEKLEIIKKNISLSGYIEGLIDVLKTGKIKDIQDYIKIIPEEYTQEVIQIISGGWDFNNNKEKPGRDEEVVDVLLAIEAWSEGEEPKPQQDETPEGEEPEDDKKETNTLIDKPIPYDKLENPSRLLQLQLFLKLGGVPTPEIKEVDGKWISALKGDNYLKDPEVSSQPNAGWIGSNKKNPRKILNRLIMAFPEENITFDNSIRIKSKKPGQKFTANEPDNLVIYRVKDGKEETIKKVDLKSDYEKWNYVLNGSEDSGYNIKLTDEQVKNFTKNKQEILKWFKYCYTDYNFNYGKDNKPKEKPVTKEIETIKKDSKGNELKSGNSLKLTSGKKAIIVDTSKDQSGKNLDNNKILVDISGKKEIIDVKDVETNTNESFYFIRESSYFVNEAVFSDFEEPKLDEVNIKVENGEDITTVINKRDDKKYRYIIWFNSKILPIQKNLKFLLKDLEQDKKELNEELNKSIYVINVLELIKIFKKAARLYIKTRIPSTRTGGAMTTARANNWETTSGDSVDPKSPSGGPFRNIKLYEKWSKIVLDIINDFDYMLKRDTSMVKLSDDSKPFKPKNSIYDFMVDALEGDKLSGLGKSGYDKKGTQLEFLRGYFGDVDIPKKLTNTIEESPIKDTKEPDTKKEDNDWIKINEITDEKSELYKIKLDSYISNPIDSSEITEFYLYNRKTKDDKKNSIRVIYLFENYNNFIKGRKGDGEGPDKLDSIGNGKDYIFLSKSNLPIKKDKLGDFDVISITGDEVKKINTGSVSINSIEKYKNKVRLKSIKTVTKETYDKLNNPFKNI